MLTCYWFHGHMCPRPCDKKQSVRLTIWLSGTQLTRVSPAFSLQSAAAFLLGMIPGFGRWTLPTFKLRVAVAHSQVYDVNPQCILVAFLLNLHRMTADPCILSLTIATCQTWLEARKSGECHSHRQPTIRWGERIHVALSFSSSLPTTAKQSDLNGKLQTCQS